MIFPLDQNHNGHYSNFEDSVEINFDSITQEHTVVTATRQVGEDSCHVHSVVMIGSRGKAKDRDEWSRRRPDRCSQRRQRRGRRGQYHRSTAVVQPSSSVTRIGRELWLNGVTLSAEEGDCSEAAKVHPGKRQVRIGATVTRLFQNTCFYTM